MTNEEMIAKYPFLRVMNLYTGKPIKGDNWDSELPIGWRNSFIESMCAEIAAVAPANYTVLQIKEKFGCLRWYDVNGNDETDAIIQKYEDISEHTCIKCGKPATMMQVNGWYIPLCKECANEK